MKITTKKEMINILRNFFVFINHNTILHKYAPELHNQIAQKHAEIFFNANKEKFETNGFLSETDTNSE